MSPLNPKYSRGSSWVKASDRGFTLIEMVIVSAIVAVTTTWAAPQFTRSIEQNRVDNYRYNLLTGIFNLKKRIQKSSKKCDLFKNLPTSSKGDYISPDLILELTNTANRGDFLDCPMGTTGRQSRTPFRFLQREGSTEKDSVEVLYLQSKFTLLGNVSKTETSQNQYSLNNQGNNDNGSDMIFRIRSKKWDQNTRLKTRCIVFSGSGHLYDGTWSYTTSECFEECPENQNCNRDDRTT